MICRKKGFIGNSWKKSNKGKEQYQDWHIWLSLPKRLHPTVTTNNANNKNLLPFSGRLLETATLGIDKSKKSNVWEIFGGPLWHFLEKYQNSKNSCKSNWFKGKIEFVGNSWKSILPRAPLDSSPQASTFQSPHLRRRNLHSITSRSLYSTRKILPKMA